MSVAISIDNGTYDLTTSVLVASLFNGERDTMAAVRLTLADLDTTNTQTLTMRVFVGGVEANAGDVVVNFRSQASLMLLSGVFLMAASDAVMIELESSSALDTAVTVSSLLLDLCSASEVASDVTTDAASRAASKADVSALATSEEIANLQAHGDAHWATADIPNAAGDGDTPVDHNTGGADNLACVTADGVGIDGAMIRAYLKSDYDAGNYTLRGRATTDSSGGWVAPMYLNSGLTYTLVFEKQGAFSVTTKEVTIP